MSLTIFYTIIFSIWLISFLAVLLVYRSIYQNLQLTPDITFLAFVFSPNLSFNLYKQGKAIPKYFANSQIFWLPILLTLLGSFVIHMSFSSLNYVVVGLFAFLPQIIIDYGLGLHYRMTQNNRLLTNQILEYVLYYILMNFTIYSIFWILIHWDGEGSAIDSFISNFVITVTTFSYILTWIILNFLFIYYIFQTLSRDQQSFI